MTSPTPSRLAGRRRGRPGGSEGSELLAIAREIFLSQGYAGATMDAVAAGAHISKQTLYRQYPAKEALYAAVVRDWVDLGYDALRPHTEALLGSADVRDGLTRLARVLQAGILGAPVLRMRALVATEARRFPDVAADYVARSWDRNIHGLAEAFGVLAARGLLHVDDAQLAAEQFTWLVIAAPLNRLSLQGVDAVRADRGVGPDSLRVVAEEGVATFLTRFG